jgi:hypothetical protein
MSGRQSGCARTAVAQLLSLGELGILEAVFLSHALSNNVYLLSHTEEGNNYVGTLLFADADSAKVVFGLLQRCINKTLTSIGSTDFSDTLAN